MNHAHIQSPTPEALAKRIECRKAKILQRLGLASMVAAVASSSNAEEAKGTAAAPKAASIHNVVLVHGAWGDGSAWRGVYDLLVKDGYSVSVVNHSNASLEQDVADTRRVLSRQDGPVILVGHSYGGAVVTEAGIDPKVVALVYIAGFVPDVGETVFGQYPKGSPQPPVEVAPDGRSFLKRDAYVAGFAPDLPKPQAEFMADSQVPLSIEKAGLAPLKAAAWHNKPSWYLLSSEDQLVTPAMARRMAARANATVRVTPGSHAAFIIHPEVAAQIIEESAQALSH